MKSLKVMDFYRLTFLSDPEPYGKKLLFVVARPVKRKNDYESKIYIYDGRITEFTSGPRDTSPKVSPDGKYLAFIGKRKEKKMQLMVMPLTDGEPRTIIEKEDISQIKWSADSKHIYFISNETKKSDDDVKIIDTYPFYFNAKGFIYNKRPTLFITSLNGREKKLTNEPYNVQAYDVSINGDLALIMNIDEQDLYWNNLYFMKNGKLKKYPLDGSFSEPEFSGDGKYLAFAYSDNKKSIFQHRKLHIYSLEKNEIDCISCEIDRNVGNSINSDSRLGMGKSIRFGENGIYFTVTDRGHSILYYYDMDGKNLSKILDNNESIDSFCIMDGKIYYISQKINYPQELYLFDGKIRRITNFNNYFLGLPEPRNFVFKASDDENVEGWFLSHDNQKKPTIVEIHGGPKTAYGCAFIFEMQLLASSGFNVLFLNPRGSEGYSDEFYLKIKEHFGERDYLDIMEGLEYGIKNFPIENERLGVIGGSYGGFMTNWIIGHTDRFKAAVTDRSISNQISFFGTSDIGPSFNSDLIGGTPFDNIDIYWEKSPLKHLRNARTPLLIIHSDEDYRCPVEQAYQIYTALKYFRKEVKMVIFPGENHELSRSGKPKHRIKRFELIKDWFSSHLLNQ